MSEWQDRIDNDLSDNAKAVGHAFFPTEESTVTFHMQKSGPSPECQAALNELVAKGFATVEPLNQFGGLVYRPKCSFHHLLPWVWERANAGISMILWQPLPSPPDPTP
jgi:hypothetical protein